MSGDYSSDQPQRKRAIIDLYFAPLPPGIRLRCTVNPSSARAESHLREDQIHPPRASSPAYTWCARAAFRLQSVLQLTLRLRSSSHRGQVALPTGRVVQPKPFTSNLILSKTSNVTGL